MTDTSAPHTDPGLEGNEKIEAAILALQQEASQELLAHALTVLRRRMQEKGQLILAVEPSAGKEQFALKTIQTPDGNLWWVAFTSFEEQNRGGGSVMSGFLADMDQLFPSAIPTDGIHGIILNPWNRTLMLDKTLLQIILGSN